MKISTLSKLYLLINDSKGTNPNYRGTGLIVPTLYSDSGPKFRIMNLQKIIKNKTKSLIDTIASNNGYR